MLLFCAVQFGLCKAKFAGTFGFSNDCFYGFFQLPGFGYRDGSKGILVTEETAVTCPAE